MNHVVAIFGGAVSGAEAADQLTKNGIQVVVFDQNTLPYGKIEDGLPMWHIKLRNKEIDRINEKLSHPLVTFVPNTQLGREIDFEDLVNNWGFSAIMLATGAWRDRSLPIEGINAYIGKGLYYQNSFIYWFNHHHEPTFKGEELEVVDDAIIIGGGLASIDVAKALMMLTVQKALAEKGHQVSIFDLDRSIAKVLAGFGLTLKDLGLKGCTIYYRRRIKDMPLSPMAADTPEKLAKAKIVQEKILNLARERYLFNVKPLHIPVDKVVENGRLVGIVFQKTKVENEKVTSIEGSDIIVKSSLVISSIGSLPEPIPGIPMKWQTFVIDQNDCCRIKGFDNVFALGNAVTGRGNINESRKHGKEVTEGMIEAYLFSKDGEEAQGVFDPTKAKIEEQVNRIVQEIKDTPILSTPEWKALGSRVQALRFKADYDGDYMKWIKEKMPVRLEDMLDGH